LPARPRATASSSASGATVDQREHEDPLDRVVNRVDSDHGEDLEIREGVYIYFLDQLRGTADVRRGRTPRPRSRPRTGV
jgi:hypothetical protein